MCMHYTGVWNSFVFEMFLTRSGEGQQKNSAITSIQLLMQSPATLETDTTGSGPSIILAGESSL